MRYEVALSIQTGWIVWVNGPFPAGRWPDINIFRHGLKRFLFPNERVEADKGYRGDKNIDAPQDNCPNAAQMRSKTLVRSRHEIVNKRLKQFNCLKNVFHHDISKHGYCFDAVAVFTQLAIEFGGEPLPSVSYHTRNT